MKVKINDTRDFAQKLNALSQNIVKSPMPILECVLIETIDDNSIVCTINNIQSAAKITFPAQVEEPGCIAVVGKMFANIVNKMPTNKPLSIEGQETIKLNGGRVKFELTAQNAEGFPKLKTLKEASSFKIPLDVLKDLTAKISSFAAKNEEKRPILKGLLFQIAEKKLDVVASDGHRLGVKSVNVDAEDGKAIISAEQLNKMLKTVGKTMQDEDITVKFDSSTCQICGENTILQITLYFGEFLKYDTIMSAELSDIINVNKSELMEVLERAELVINSELSSNLKVPLKLEYSSGTTMNITTSVMRSRFSEEISIDIKQKKSSDDPFVIGINCTFLKEALQCCHSETVTLGFTHKTGSVFIIPETEGEKYMILPVRLYN